MTWRGWLLAVVLSIAISSAGWAGGRDRECSGYRASTGDCDRDGKPNWRDPDWQDRNNEGEDYYRDDDGDGIINSVDPVEDEDVS